MMCASNARKTKSMTEGASLSKNKRANETGGAFLAFFSRPEFPRLTPQKNLLTALSLGTMNFSPVHRFVYEGIDTCVLSLSSRSVLSLEVGYSLLRVPSSMNYPCHQFTDPQRTLLSAQYLVHSQIHIDSRTLLLKLYDQKLRNLPLTHHASISS